MAKVKVHELAKELEIQSKDVIAFLAEKGIEAKAATSLTMQQSIDYQLGISKCKGTDKDGDGKTDTNSLRDAKIKYILSLPYDYNTKLALFKLNYTSDSALKAFKQAAGK